MIHYLFLSFFNQSIKPILLRYLLGLPGSCIILCSAIHAGMAQVEFSTWGNINGIRVAGQLVPFETSISVINKDWTRINNSDRENQYVNFHKENNKKIFDYVIDSIKAIHSMEDVGVGTTSISIEYTLLDDKNLGSAFFHLQLPPTFSAALITSPEGFKKTVNQLTWKAGEPETHTSSKNLTIKSSANQLQLTLNEKSEVFINRDSANPASFHLYIKVLSGDVAKGKVYKKNLVINASGVADKEEVSLVLDTTKKGPVFEGLGGNFRLQNDKTDPQVIDYCLANLPISWARVEMPWRFWQPEESKSPDGMGNATNLHPKVKSAMEITQRLFKMGNKIIVSNWSAPDWAIQGPYTPKKVNGIWGNPLNAHKTQQIYESIANYLLYLKQNYGVEVEAFSFNESDLGINIRQTPLEHQQLIKGLGAYLASKGLKTKLLLGDTADVTGWPFAKEAGENQEINRYVSAVSFHSWRGYSDENLSKWPVIAKNTNTPLIVGEGSIDADAWRYPSIFEEPTYAMDEINLYIKILSLCQPVSILQWQLTADYSLLAGGGIFGNTAPLHPTQRFWNLKQLAATPPKANFVSVNSNKQDVSCVALSNSTKGNYAIHLVNKGAVRQVKLNGLPVAVKNLTIYITNKDSNMKEGKPVEVVNGQAIFSAPANSFVSLIKNN